MTERWWDNAVVYQVYPRSFADADGDGTGDLAGITGRLDHLSWLGVDALWLSPVYPSPMADGGYDVADYTGIDPRFGTLADFDALVEAAHARDIKVLMDVVPCHTSIEHPWFRDHPERYVWSDRDGPQNNWRATFGGPAWSPDPHGRGWYLHSFYPQQPDLDWRHPDVAQVMGDVLRTWLDRGVDGFRLDAIDRLLKDPGRRDDPPADGPPPLPEGSPDVAALRQVHSRNAPGIGDALSALRAAAGDALLVGEVYLPTRDLGPYLEHLDVAFSFELLHAPWRQAEVRAALAAAQDVRAAWVLSNHDFPRLPDRVGPEHARAAGLLALALPGPVFVYQGDELGTGNGAQPDPPDDRHGRDPFRSPMCWDADAPHGGFTTGTPWLPASNPPEGGVAQQRGRDGSTLELQRALIALRRQLRGPLELLDAGPDVLALRRGEHVVAVNLGAEPAEVRGAGEVLVATGAEVTPQQLAPGGGFVALAT